MKGYLTSLLILLAPILSIAQDMNKTIEQRLTAIEDKRAIKYVVDEFSNLADTKDIDQQVLLFTEDGEVYAEDVEELLEAIAAAIYW